MPETPQPSHTPAADLSSGARYPIGRFHAPSEITPADRARFRRTIAELPTTLDQLTNDLSPSQLETPYREGGWTVRQLIHHVADSHLNAYSRFRLALTEDCPVIKPYYEDRWAELPDARSEDIRVSLDLLRPLHRRWSVLLESMTDDQYARAYRHPEMGEMPLDRVLALYDWHSRHHTAHITSLRSRLRW